MNNINIYMITCDKSNHILNVTIPLLDKYWNIPKSVKILGFNIPNIILPLEYEFISMKPNQISIDEWARDIYSVIKNDTNEFIIFMLDDFLPIDYINTEIFNLLFDIIKNDKSVVRCALGIDFQFLPHVSIMFFNGFDLIEQNQDSLYRITTQPSIWRKDYLLNFLYKSTNPWNFETQNNPKDGKKIIGTYGKYAFRWIEESALSGRHPNKINILGLKPIDVKWLVDSGFLDVNILQYGQHIGNVPQFSQYGYGFKIDILKTYINELGYNQYVMKYKSSYE